MKKNTKFTILWLLLFSLGFIGSFGGLYMSMYNPVTLENKATIMIDPGHGGYDVGAVGYDGSYEKDINLKMAKLIGSTIKKMDPSIHVIYTRESDYVSWPNNESEDLKERVNLANQVQADYFLSIHCNASQNSDATGYSFYMKNGDTISTQTAQNASTTLNTFKWSKSQGIEFTSDASLYVIDSLEKPAILFEMGFISNKKECARLQRWYNQKIIAYAIANAYVSTIQKNLD